MKRLLLYLFCPVLAFGQSQGELLPYPVTPRIQSMGGAYVALADDPHAGYLNPAGVSNSSQVGYDLCFAYIDDRSIDASKATDFMTAAYLNPSSGNNSSFAMGVWATGFIQKNDYRFLVPYVGTGWQFSGKSQIGLVLRSVIRYTELKDEDTRYAYIGDLSFLQDRGGFRLGALVERAFGGSMGMVPRRLRWGAALVPSSRLALAFEWRGDETNEKFNFHWNSSHVGGEINIGQYLSLRGGYKWDKDDGIPFMGLTLGTPSGGWRLLAAIDSPSAPDGITRWSAALAYRLF